MIELENLGLTGDPVPGYNGPCSVNRSMRES